MFDEADLRLTVDDSKQYENPRENPRVHSGKTWEAGANDEKERTETATLGILTVTITERDLTEESRSRCPLATQQN